MRRKLLFLDFDGVLNTSHDKDPHALNKKHLDILNQIMEKHNPDVIISSTWRCFYPLKVLKEVLVIHGFKYPDRVIDVTPDLSYAEKSGIYRSWTARGGEIQQWIDDNIGVQSEKAEPLQYSICILDDMGPDQFGGVKRFLVMTSMDYGLHKGHLKQVDMIYAKQEDGFKGFKK